MTRKLLNFKSRLIPLSMLRLIICLSLLLFISCSSEGSTPSPSSDPTLNSIRSLTLEGVTENSITVSWGLLKTEGGGVDSTITYIVYAETNDGGSGEVFTKDDITEIEYPINSEATLGEAEVTNLTNNTPYRIVVEASIPGSTSRAELLVYTGSVLDTAITDVEVATVRDQEEVTVTWTAKPGAQGYAIKGSFKGNLLGEIIEDDIIMVVCLPDSLLCQGTDQFAKRAEGDKLEYKVKVHQMGVRYDLVVVSFNFRDLSGLQAVDEQGLVKTFTEEVLAQIEDEDSDLSKRLKEALDSEDNIEKVNVRVTEAWAPTDLSLSPSGSTVLATWKHGVGAEYYYAFISNDGGVDPVTNIVARYQDDGSVIEGYTIFTNLTPATRYTVTVQSFTVISNSTNLGGSVSNTISTTTKALEVPDKVAAQHLTLTNHEPGKLRVVWNTPKVDSVIRYDVYYWIGSTPPDKPQATPNSDTTNVVISKLDPGSYTVRVDTLYITDSGPDVKTGEDSDPIIVYGKPLSPSKLAVDFSQGSFTVIGNKFYATEYPLTYTEADGQLSDVSYLYRYQVVGEPEWVDYAEVTDQAMIALQVEDLSDAAVIKAGYGKQYRVEVIASNAGGFTSDPTTHTFVYQSFPEPFMHSKLTVTSSNRSLTVAWPEVTEANGSTVSSYTVLLKDDFYGLPVQSNYTSEMETVFDGLKNNHPYYITVIPNGRETGNIFNALSVVTGYKIGEAITEGSEEARILTAYTGAPVAHAPQGAPEKVKHLAVTAGDNQAIVTWEATTNGSPATGYELQYLENVAKLITYLNVIGDDADTELSDLSWERATSIEVPTNSTGNYSNIVDGLNVTSATNVFRVRAVRDEGVGAYRYYALGTEPSRAPSLVENLDFSNHSDTSFKVTWLAPRDPGRNRKGGTAILAGYRVSWWTDAQVDGRSNVIDNADTLSYTITGLTPGTQYYVRVEAKNDNTEGYIYNVGRTNSTYTLKPPGTVTGITYSGHTINGFTVSWDAVDAGFGTNGPASVTYLVQRKDPGGDWEMVTRSDYRTNQETFTDLIPGTNYWVRVTATNGFVSAPSSEGGETWTFSLPGRVSDPTVIDPSYDKESDTGGFTVRWAVPTNTGILSNGKPAAITGYEVSYRKEDSKSYIPVDHEDDMTKHVFTNFTANTQYYIRIQAKTVAGTGPEKYISGWVPSLPGAVAQINLSSPNATNIKIEWAAPQAGRAGGASSTNATTTYKVMIYSDNGGSYTEVTNNYESNSITATGLVKGITYTVQITAKNIWGEAIPSTATRTTADNTAEPPSPVRGLTVADFTATQVVLSWLSPTDLGTDASGSAEGVYLTEYVVKYKKTVDTNSPFTQIYTDSKGVRLAEVTSANATVVGLSPGTTYTFLVKAVNSANAVGRDDDASTVEQTTVPPIPPSPVRDLMGSFADNRVMLSWIAPTNTGTDGTKGVPLAGYVVKYKTADFIEIDDAIEKTVRLTEPLTADSTNATVVGLDQDTSYTFLVVAFNSANVFGRDDDALQVTLSTIPLPDIPENLRKTDTCDKATSVDLAWDTSTNATFYKLYRNDNQGNIEIKSNHTTSYTDTDLTAATDYTYTVQACSTNGCSDDSDPLDITTLGDKNFKAIIDSREIPSSLSGYDERSQEIFSRYPGGASLMAKYVRVDGSDNKDGTSFADAARDPKAVLDGITDAKAANVYVVLIAGGTYIPSGTMKMQNYVAIIGGVDECLGSSETVTALDGDGARRVFYNKFSSDNKLTNTALLYGVTVTNGKADNGGGMYNHLYSSPSLVEVTFSGNTADGYGGGIYNNGKSSPSLERVTFSGNSANQGGGIYNEDESSPSLERVTFSGNSANQGGGIYNAVSSPILKGVTFSENSSGKYGGGMYNTDFSSPSLTNVTFFSNTAEWGGGIYNNKSSPILEGVTFSGNSATTNGGGIYNNGSSPRLEGVTFSSNRADNQGGGIYNASSSPILKGVTFSRNSAYMGGGIFNYNSPPDNNSPLVLERVTFSENSAGWAGGGIYNSSSSPILKMGTFFNNTAADGGGMYNDESSPNLIGVTFSENRAIDSYPPYYGKGGGMYNDESSPKLIGITFFSNKADRHGGGIYHDINNLSAPEIVNGIFWGNTASKGLQQIYIDNKTSYPEELRIYNSIVQGGTGTLVSEKSYTDPFAQGGFVSDGGTASVKISFSNIIDKDPELLPLADNGGSVLTHAIPSTSPAVNEGLYVRMHSKGRYFYSLDNSNWYWNDPGLTTSATQPYAAEYLPDATGYTRNRDDRPDLGAYEAR